MNRLVDPAQLLLMAALVDWTAVFRRQPQHAASPKDIQSARRLKTTRLVQLRWLGAPGLGLPSEPFRVWRRPSLPFQGEKPIAAPMVDYFNTTLMPFSPVLRTVRGFVRAPAADDAIVLAFSGAPLASALVGSQVVPAGATREVRFAGPQIACLMLSPGAEIDSLRGYLTGLENDDSWKLVEIVGLPVDGRFNGVQDWHEKQGLVGTLGDPADAALDRFRRGAPFYGWLPQVAAGFAAPTWQLADPAAMLDLLQARMLDPLLQMLQTRPPGEHQHFEQVLTLPAMTGVPAHAAVTRSKPLHTLLFGAATDPLGSLVSGFGTAIEEEDIPPLTFGDRQFFGDDTRSDWDYMVTARWAKGLDGQSAPLELASYVLAPPLATQPPAPVNLRAQSDGLRTPATTDADYGSVARVTWDRPNAALPFRIGSFAFVRQAVAPATGVDALMDPRPNDVALQPISCSGYADAPEPQRLAALDDRYALASAPNPNALNYGVAHQDLMGLWSGWSSAALALGEPPPKPLTIVYARLEVEPRASGACPARLVVEYSWDWGSRSPRQFEFVGRLYAQAHLGQPPADPSVPTGLPMQLGGGAGAVLGVLHNGNPGGTPTQPSATLAYVSFDGQQLLAAAPTPAGPRRYRLSVEGLQLDFNAAPRIGLALWARAVEQRAPQRQGPWSAQPAIASTADPRPPVLQVEHEDVLLTSMADASGLHHARIAWPAAPGAAGYFVYTVAEEKFRADRGLPSPPKSLTLAERLAALRDGFADDPGKRSFTRLNAQPQTATSMAVTLPRGSKEIHLYVVVAASAGGVESAWPDASDPLRRKRPIAYAAPQVVQPMAPSLEVERVLDRSVDPPAHRATVVLRNGAGPRVTRVELYRVRTEEGAVALDTMGPPVASITGGSARWQVTPASGPEPGQTQPLSRIEGHDDVAGSWRRVFYRAVAWAADDAARGLYGGRSAPSALRELVVPPATPPDLGALASSWPGGDVLALNIDAVTSAPVEKTPLGPHRVRVDLLAEAADGSSRVLFSHPDAPGGDDRLDNLAVLPPPAGAVGLCRSGVPGGTRLRLQCRRPDASTRLRVRMLLTDPLGRATERVLDVAPGLPIPAPSIGNVAVQAVLSRGNLLAFDTTALFTDSSLGPYRLQVAWQSALNGLGLLGTRVEVDLALPDLRPMAAGENLMLDAATLPARRTPARNPAPGITGGIVLALRGRFGGRLVIRLLGPDGRSASLNRTLR